VHETSFGDLPRVLHSPWNVAFPPLPVHPAGRKGPPLARTRHLPLVPCQLVWQERKVIGYSGAFSHGPFSDLTLASCQTSWQGGGEDRGWRSSGATFGSCRTSRQGASRADVPEPFEGVSG